MKIFQKFIPALVILTAVLAIFVQNRFFPKEYGTRIEKNDKYSVWKTEEGTYLLKMYHFPKYSDERSEDYPIASVEQMRERILTGDIPGYMLEELRPSAAAGDGIMEILDLDALWDVCLPEDLCVDYVYWSGKDYSVSLSSTGNEDLEGYFSPPQSDSQSYAEMVTEWRQGWLDQVEQGKAALYEWTVDGGPAEVFVRLQPYARWLQSPWSPAWLSYEIGEPGRRIHVRAQYQIMGDGARKKLDTVTVLYENCGNPFSVGLYCNTRPDSQWLMEFGVVPLETEA